MAVDGKNLAIWRGAVPRVRHCWRMCCARTVSLSSALIELAFPTACSACDCHLDCDDSSSRLPFCADCLKEISIYEPPFCPRCGCSVEGTAGQACAKCWNSQLHFDETVALGHYDGLLRDLVLRMKKPSGDRISLAIARLMWSHCQARLEVARPDLVAPIPMHWWRRINRGTNSALLVAEVLAGKLRLPLEAGLLQRRRNTLPQSGLLPTQRLRNLRGALAVTPGYALQGARVLLVDDIMTTGSTCNVAARVLAAAGAGAVVVAVVARSPAN